MAECILVGHRGSGGSSSGGGIAPVDSTGKPTGNITIPNGVVNVANSLFSANSNITSVKTEDTVISIGAECFKNCTGLRSADFANVNNLYMNSFWYASNLESVEFGAVNSGSILSLNSGCFKGCSSLSSITIDSNITSVSIAGSEVFYYCSALTDTSANAVLSLVNTYSSISNFQKMFYGCTSLINVTTPVLGAYMFSNCSGLKTVIVTGLSLITGIGNYAFEACFALESVTLPSSGILSIGSFVFSGTKIASIVIPNTVTSMAEGVFANCADLQSVTYSSGLTEVPRLTFKDCQSLTTLSFPSSVVTVRQRAFYGCTGLESITFGGNVSFEQMSNTENNPFYNCTALKTIQVPNGFSNNLYLSNGGANYTNVLTHDGLVALIDNLYDYSGGTAHTLTIGATNLARLSAAEQAVATAKNWTLA